MSVALETSARPTSRAERLAQIVSLRESGRTHKEIAAVLGVSPSTVRNVLYDPDGRKQLARRDRYRGTCHRCGAKTSGSEGYAKAPRTCGACSLALQHENRYWTRERVVDAIRRFAAEHGRPPVATEWLYGNHGQDVDGYPNATAALREFGKWADAIEAAGFPRPTKGHNLRGAKNKPRGYVVATEEYVARLAAASSHGIAPSSGGRPGSLIWEQLSRRGISWAEACALAGVKPRRPRALRRP